MKYKNIDLMRALSALAVIVLHVSSGYVLRYEPGLILNQMARFCVPGFIIVSGFVLYKKGQILCTPDGYKTFLRTRFLRILPPYFIWSVLYLFYRNLRDGGVTLKSAVYDAATGQAYIHLYFIFILVQLYFLFPFLTYFYEKHEKATVFTSFAITLVSQAAIYLHQLGHMYLPSFFIPYTRMFFPYLFFFVLGINVRDHYKKYLEKLTRFKYGLSFLLALSFALAYFDGVQTKTYGISVKPSVIPYTVLVFLCVVTFFDYLNGMPDKRRSFPAWFSKQSFCIYFVHPLFLSLLYETAERTDHLTFLATQSGALALFLLTVLLSCLFAWLLSLTRWASLFGGVPLKKKN